MKRLDHNSFISTQNTNNKQYIHSGLIYYGTHCNKILLSFKPLLEILKLLNI